MELPRYYSDDASEPTVRVAIPFGARGPAHGFHGHGLPSHDAPLPDPLVDEPATTIDDPVAAPAPRRAWARWIAAAAVVGAVTVGAAYTATRPVPVSVVPVARGTAIEAVYATGSVEPVDRVEVKARVGGAVTELLVREGDAVRRGQLLARIDAPSLSYDVDRGRADLLAANARAAAAPQLSALRAQAAALSLQLRDARAEVDRVRELTERGTSATVELERARLAVAGLHAELAANRAQQRDTRIGVAAEASRRRAEVASLEARADDAEVRAPIDGRVLGRYVEPGEVVGVNQNLLRVGDVERLELEARVDESDVGRLRVGMAAAARFPAFAGRVVRARLVRIAPDADRARKQFGVVLRLDEPLEGLRPGMTAEINLIVRERPGALLAPADAVRDGHVWVVDADDRLRSRAVRAGARDLTRVELASGVREGDRVVSGDVAGGARDGLRVRAHPAAPGAASAGVRPAP